MSFSQNLSYAGIQVVHNLGAVATVGTSLSALWLREHAIRRRLGFVALAGWLTQGLSGATFGIVSYYFYGRLPDISGIARYALGLKMACATFGTLLLLTYLWRSWDWPEGRKTHLWRANSALSVTALSAAAFLRWFA